MPNVQSVLTPYRSSVQRTTVYSNHLFVYEVALTCMSIDSVITREDVIANSSVYGLFRMTTRTPSAGAALCVMLIVAHYYSHSVPSYEYFFRSSFFLLYCAAST